MANETNQSEVNAALQAVLPLHGANLLDNTPAAGKALALPSGMSLHSLKELVDEYALRPDRRAGTAHVESLESFAAYVNRFKNHNSAIFAGEGRRDDGGMSPCLVGVIDHHDAGPEVVDVSAARFGVHRCEYAFPVSDEWKAWHKISGQGLSLPDFAEFLEDHLADVVDPERAGDGAKTFAANLGLKLASPARLLELSKGLAVHAQHTAAASIDLNTGEQALQFSEKHGDAKGAPLSIPGGFVLGIPVFRLGKRYQVCVRLRYRVNGPSVTWICKLHRTDLVFEAAFAEACDATAKGTELPVFRGTPEK
jgi:hypothetical protein